MRILSIWMAFKVSLYMASITCQLPEMENLVTFGDSYTDESRLMYITTHHGQTPPPGQLLPPNNASFSGGYTWGRIAANITGARYYDYAVSGAACSNKIILRNLTPIDAPYPSVLEYEISAFINDTTYKNLYPNRLANNTVYAIWIGTNDLGFNAFLSDSQVQGATLSTFVDCVWEVFDKIYSIGGRRLVLFNELPLHLTPAYASQDMGGAGDNGFWLNKTEYNTTEYQNKMLQYTSSVNAMFDYGIPFYHVVKRRWIGATIAIFDAHSLLLDIHANPDSYLTVPGNTTGYYRHCEIFDQYRCFNSTGAPSSFMWYDELHPSQRTDEIIAKEFLQLINGTSRYGKTYRA